MARTGRKPVGTMLAPLVLRLVLGTTFLWAGLSKLEATMPVKGEQAALLANLGVDRVRAKAPPGPTTPPAPPAPESKPEAGSEPKADPTSVPATQPIPQPAPSPDPSPVPEQQPSSPGPAPGSDTPRAHEVGLLTLAQVTAPGVGTPPARVAYAPSEFPDEIEVPRVYGLAILLHRSAFPPVVRREGEAPSPPPDAIWPKSLGRGSWPVRLAWTVALTEVVGGAFLILGLFTRVSAAAVAGTMLGAMWLTELGPAWQSGKTVLGILPDRDLFAIELWRAFFWQLSLLASGVGVALLGCGALGLDRKFFPPPPPAPPPGKPLI
jgi:uncharacterized membrane protein YphA (DoxX/SURF4 family)